MRYLLDTNVLSGLLRDPRGPLRERIAAAGGRAGVCTSIIVASELRFGAEKRGSTRLSGLVEDLLDRIPVMALDAPTDRHYARIRAAMERGGTVVGGNDLLIAAHALALDCILVTDNVGEFRHVPGLAVENWLRPART